MQLQWAANKAWVRISTPGIIDRMLEHEGVAHLPALDSPGIPKSLISDRDCPQEGPEGDADRAFMKGKPFRSRVGALLWIS